jgi:hypothetical protein
MSWVIPILYIRQEDVITAAEEVADHIHDLDIRAPFLQALAALKQRPGLPCP